MIDLSAPAEQVFEILESYDYTVKMWDADGSDVIDPADARRFFALPSNMMVAMLEDGENTTIRLFISPKTNVSSVLGLVDRLHTCATGFNLLFNVRQHNKEIEPKDFSTLASVTESISDKVARTANQIIENCRKVLR